MRAVAIAGALAAMFAARAAFAEEARREPFAEEARREPAFDVDSSVGDRDALARASLEAWRSYGEVFAHAAPDAAPPASAPLVRVRLARALSPGEAAKSRPGTIELRSAVSSDPRALMALRHEVAHQFLWNACPAASEDALFHEAWALAGSGELPEWTDEEYLGVSAAKKILASRPSLDTREARRAIARLLANAPLADGGLPRPLARKVAACASPARWIPLEASDLADSAGETAADAQIAVSRWSGEILFADGAAARPMPYGSTLKPFLVAGAKKTPVLAPQRVRAEWRCGDEMPDAVDARTAVLLSCNGWFLDWSARDPSVLGFGAWGPVLQDLGLARLPESASEAIGLRPTLALSPWALAQAYRLLAASRPDMVAWLQENVDRGTLAGLDSSPAMKGVATKTGTVRAADNDPMLGWIVAVDDDVVVVTARAKKAPRTFLADAKAGLDRARAMSGIGRAEVQTFGLGGIDKVKASCVAHAWIAAGDGPVAVARSASNPSGVTPIGDLVKQGPALCLGGAWHVRVDGAPEPDREYAGVFRGSPAPAMEKTDGLSEKRIRARRGSDVVFATTLARYVTGVLDAEEAGMTGPVRVALARVIAHNSAASGERHPGRPPCDSTHCTLFRGTRAADAEIAQALRAPALRWNGWLPYSQGGDEPWTERRSAAEVGQALGATPRALRFESTHEGGRVRYLRSDGDGGEAIWDESVSEPCEPFRNALRLPSCPSRASIAHGLLVFEGKGRGHSLGMDIDGARASGRSADEILEASYARSAK